MRALILNSGMGSRMGVLTSEHPKCMTEISPKETILSRQLKLLAEAGFTRDPKTGLLARDGREFRFTFLSRSSMEDKFLALFDASLRKLGVAMSIERKDYAGWMRDMDFRPKPTAPRATTPSASSPPRSTA